MSEDPTPYETDINERIVPNTSRLVTIKIPTDNGELVDLRTYQHDSIPGLCVSNHNLDRFEITHIKSGKSICTDFERFWHAALQMAKLQKLAIKYSFSWDVSSEELKQSTGLKESRASFICKDVETHNRFAQFPWEDAHPGDAFDKLITDIDGDTDE